MKPNEFLESQLYKKLDNNTQVLLRVLIDKLGNLDYVIIKRNEPVLVFKVRIMFESNPKSQSNIATVRLKQGYITVGPYKNRDENAQLCKSTESINEKLIDDIKKIYWEKL